MSKIKIEDALTFRVGPGFDLADVDPSSTPHFDGDKDDLKAEIAAHDDELKDIQETLWANSIHDTPGTGSLLIVAQGMDTSGKGGLIKRAMRPFHPLGTRVIGFGSPTKEELRHDFLWRIRPHEPNPGEVVFFDRSHYEDVLIQRVEKMASDEEIERRYGAIVNYENELVGNGTRIIKVMLHISREFQEKNLRDRLADPEKQWKYSPSDLEARAQWDEYMEAYQIAIERTSTHNAPWYCIPGDNKHYARAVVKHLMIHEMRDMRMSPPRVDFDPEEELKKLELS